ncbi:hypothetical protein ACLF3G_12265 [Falsiroseomonas sp. HC035]|uniref:hypothetical protein n=1 Tax=Falsiroseomonas sp. HC035 TaxID=3390999 RepID=UPI003D314823
MVENQRVWSPDSAARWLAEAVETGNALTELPEDIAPRDATEGLEVAFAILERLDIPPCGIRLLYRPGAETLIGPMIEGRLVPAGTPIALDALRNPTLTAAAIGVLAAPLDPHSDEAPCFATLHAALDVSATRHADATGDTATRTADLALLGLVVAGRGKPLAPMVVSASLGARGGKRTVMSRDLGAAFAEAAGAARSLGGLPAGGLLVVAGLTPSVQAAGVVTVSLGPLGRLASEFA